MGSVQQVHTNEIHNDYERSCYCLDNRQKKAAIILVALLAISLLAGGALSCILASIGIVSPMSVLSGIALLVLGGFVSLALSLYLIYKQWHPWYPSLDVHTDDVEQFAIQ